MLQAATAPLVARAKADGADWFGRLRRQGLVDVDGKLVFAMHGGMEDLSRFHTTLVKGGAWAGPAGLR